MMFAALLAHAEHGGVEHLVVSVLNSPASAGGNVSTGSGRCRRTSRTRCDKRRVCGVRRYELPVPEGPALCQAGSQEALERLRRPAAPSRRARRYATTQLAAAQLQQLGAPRHTRRTRALLLLALPSSPPPLHGVPAETLVKNNVYTDVKLQGGNPDDPSTSGNFEEGEGGQCTPLKYADNEQLPTPVPYNSLRVFNTGGDRGLGLTSLQPIPKGTVVVEMSGRVVPEHEYERYSTPQTAYVVSFDDATLEAKRKNEMGSDVMFIDMEKHGTLGRFANHSKTRPSVKLVVAQGRAACTSRRRATSPPASSSRGTTADTTGGGRRLRTTYRPPRRHAQVSARLARVGAQGPRRSRR